MSSPIDPIRRSNLVRRAQRPHTSDREDTPDVEDRSVPAIYDPAPTPPPGGSAEGAAAFNAQLLGQDGQRRGLRGGPETLGAARSVYTKTEWSGPADRRARKGGVTKTEI
ncbi:MAG: hypothetical protein Q8Q88_09905 [Phenylobacterium sp.]|uniref:hypothetical protein n=1 Tax=Phenylobacterium sp. TaxID=1871053 RepID=UPI0027329DD1|nr:hypothetical protein [Phenylobacterium sp.]MDP3747348.1 hypothetical protein [Phenylobacterium sp.]